MVSLPMNVDVLTTLKDGPRSLSELRRAAGSPPPTTMRKQLRALTEHGVLERHQDAGFPGSVAYELGPAGADLLGVAKALDRWLAESPRGQMALGTPAAKNATKALVEGWSSTIVRALAARPLSLTELNRLIVGLNYPSLERRLGALRLNELIEVFSTPGRGTPYVATEWLRRAVAPLTLAARWERLHASAASPSIGQIDIEAAFLLAVPLAVLPKDVSGRCRLVVELRGGGGEPGLAGVVVEVEEGRVGACVTRLEGKPTATVSGTTSGWLEAMVDPKRRALEFGGDCDLGPAVVEGLARTFSRRRQSPASSHPAVVPIA